MEPNVTWTNPTGLANARNPVANQRQYPPVITLRGFNIGGGTNFPQFIGQDVYTLRNDLTISADLRGRHDMRFGGEYLKYLMWHDWCNFLRGNLIADNGPVPANIEQLFPGLERSEHVEPRRAVADLARVPHVVRPLQHPQPARTSSPSGSRTTGSSTSRLTLNLGVRYDVETDTFANELGVEPFLPANRPLDTDNVVPRVGFAYSLNDRTVIRGGAGKYYAWLINQVAHPIRFANSQRVLSALYDGRADFAVNPWNGPLPRAEDLEQAFCNVNFVPGCIRRALGQTIAPPNAENPYSYQASIGVQRQIGDTMGVTVDYSYNGSAQGSGPELQHQPQLQSGDRAELPVHRHQPPAVSRVGPGADGHLRGLEQLSRTGGVVHQAAEQPLAGLGHLQPLRRSATAIPNPWSGVMNPVPFPLQDAARRETTGWQSPTSVTVRSSTGSGRWGTGSS